jgi:signal peptidase I
VANPPYPSDEYIVFLQERHYETFLNLENVLNGWPIEQARAETPLDSTLPQGLIRTQVLASQTSQAVFPNPDTGHGERINSDTWDNLGPIYIPKKGVTVSIDETNIYSYQKVISEYEGHDLRVSRDGIVKIDGDVATEYTFEKDYYWMMGDNRHNSFDSRGWGYVPEDHIVGKPVFIWMSYDKHGEGLKKIRTDRVFTTVNGEGERTSYFWHFIAVIALYQVVLFFRRRKKA